MIQKCKDKLDKGGPAVIDRIFILPAFVFIIVGFMPFFVSKFVGYRFVISEEYYIEHDIFSCVFASLCFIYMNYVFWVYGLAEKSRSWGYRTGPSGFALVTTKIFGPLLVSLLAYEVPMAAYPMLHALIAGNTTTLEFTVKDATGWSDRKCRPEVWLENLPPMHNSICFVDEEFRKLLRPGMRIEIEGWGTADGVFLRKISIP